MEECAQKAVVPSKQLQSTFLDRNCHGSHALATDENKLAVDLLWRSKFNCISSYSYSMLVLVGVVALTRVQPPLHTSGLCLHSTPVIILLTLHIYI